MRNFRLPFNHLAADEFSGAFHCRACIRAGELLQLPYTRRLDRAVRSQRDRVYIDRDAHVPNPDALRFLPHQQQLHAQFDGLLWLPPSSFPKHYVDWRERTESRHGWVSDYGLGLCVMPSDHHLVCGSF